MRSTFTAYIKNGRKSKGLSMAQLAVKTDLSTSFLSKIENGIQRGNARTVTRIAMALELDPTIAMMHWLADQLPEEDRGLVPMLSRAETEDEVFLRVWEFHASLCDVHMDKVSLEVTVDLDGNAGITRIMEGIEPRKGAEPLKEYRFHTTIPVECDPKFAGAGKLQVMGRPADLAMNHTVEQTAKERTHVFEFPGGWSWREGAGNSLSVATRSFVQGAFYMDLESALRDYRESGLERLPMNSYAFHVTNPVDHLELAVALPDGYLPLAVQERTWRGKKNPWATEALQGKRVALSKTVHPEGNPLVLRVTKPLPDFSFALAWEPIRQSEYRRLLK